MKLLVGLGNPGSRYAGSRHNVGFEIAVAFAVSHGVALAEDRFHGRYGRGSLAATGDPPTDASADPGVDADVDVGVLLPATFMNASGDAVAAAVAGLSLDPSRDLLVAYDDLDLPLGRLRLRPAGGAGGHNGVASIIDALGTREFARLRFGIGRPPDRVDPVSFVLARFTPAERATLPARVDRAVAAAETVFRGGIAVAMDRYNREPAPDEVEPARRSDEIVPSRGSWMERIRRRLSR